MGLKERFQRKVTMKVYERQCLVIITLLTIAVDKYLAKIQERCDECRLVLVCHTDSYILDNITW